MSDSLYAAVCEHCVDLVIPVTDAVILPLSQERDRFEKACRLAIPHEGALRLASDKQATLETARRVGIPTPNTRVVTTVAEALEAARDLDFPVVLKPSASRIYRDGRAVERFTVAYASCLDDLATQMARFAGSCSVLLQEYCAGVGCGVELLMSRGRPLAAFQHRRIREVPVTGGASAFRESVRLDPQLYDHAIRLMSEMDWTGLAMVEFKLTDDGPRLMEVNGRVWGSLPLAVHSGMDFPALMAQMYLFGAPAGAVDTSYRIGVRSRNLRLELLWIAQAIRGRRRYPFLPHPTRLDGIRALLHLINPRCRFDILSASDPRPGLADMMGFARAAAHRIGGGA
jgi:predicted ATP-grasp superfamily ATP-dependent carboligase